MNEVTFILALLFEKNVITREEAIALRKVAVEQTISNDLGEMQKKIRTALESKESSRKLENINAKDLL